MTAVQSHILNRELSWLDFNSRVLEEAAHSSTPLIDRLKFIAIFSANLDEFFMVRVAGLRQQKENDYKGTDPSGLTVDEQLDRIRQKVESLTRRQYQLLQKQILVQLEQEGICRIAKPHELSQDQQESLKRHFCTEILPVLTPVAVDPSHPFPILTNQALEIAVLLQRASSKNQLKAFVEVPAVLPRFMEVHTNEDPLDKTTYVLLEDLILTHLDMLFSNCKILETIPFRVTRDMDFNVDQEGIADLLRHMEKQLKYRRRREPIRLEIPMDADPQMMNWLMRKLEVDPQLVYHIPGPLDLAGFFELVERESDERTTEPEWPPLPCPLIADDEPVFESIRRQGTIPLFVPFEAFDPVVRMLEEAADDPDVLAIKQTLYRVSGDSPVVRALQRAAENGKQVTVIVEVKARFDEERNIAWARRLEESGAHVIYGIVGLKIHCKALLVIRREEGRIQRYVHLATGNYNDKTARLYTDAGYFSNDSDLATDIAALFNVMTGYSEPPEWRRIAAAPFDLRETMLAKIQREARLSTPRTPGHIRAKMNSLVDPEIIENLLNAAKAGVKIELIVRGTCCLKPGDLVKNIKVISIVDRFLEHTRMFRFENAGRPEYFLASADWMPRNLDRRIELFFPVFDSNTRKIIDRLFELQFKDKCRGRTLKADGSFTNPRPTDTSNRSQRKTYEFFQKRLHATRRKEPKKKIAVMKNPKQ
jgi:polyphosphate kinase